MERVIRAERLIVVNEIKTVKSFPFCVKDSSEKPGPWRNIFHVSFTGGLATDSLTVGHALINECFTQSNGVRQRKNQAC